ncbi:hypothetical protein LINPERHAP2_LOCUS37304 [Linum perenne]
MESLLNQTTNLNLSRPERVLELSPIIPDNNQEGSFSLVGKMLTTKAITMGIIKGATRRPWSLAGSIDTKFLKDNTFIFTFSSEENREQIWAKRPWVIADHLLVLKKEDGYNNPDDVPFDFMELWVQLHNIPAKYKSLENIKTIANSYFKFLDVDTVGVQPGTWHRFVRVWAEVDLREPLPDYFIIPTRAAKERVDFVYEKATDLCKSCSRIGHTEYVCQEDPGSPFDAEGLARTTRYLRSPGGTQYGNRSTPTSSPNSQRLLVDFSGASTGGEQSAKSPFLGNVGSAGHYPPTASSRISRSTARRGTDADIPRFFTPTTEDLYHSSKEPTYNSKIRKEVASVIVPRKLGFELEGEDGGSGLRVEPGPFYPPGFSPLAGQQKESESTCIWSGNRFRKHNS